MLLGMIAAIGAQGIGWNAGLVIPERVSVGDSNGIHFGAQQGLYIKKFTSKDSVLVNKNTGNYGLRQSADYSLTNDYWLLSQEHSFDLSGEIEKKHLPLGISCGLEWSPVFLYNTHSSVKSLLGSFELGPVVRFESFPVPVAVHVGGALRAWNDSLYSSLSQMSYMDLQKDKGMYAAMEIGRHDERLFNLPLFASFTGYGRSMSTSKLIAATGSVLAYQPLDNGDSLFGAYSDSLLNGRNAFLGQSGAKPHFIEDPLKIERSYQLSAGYKGAAKLFLEPSLLFSYSEHTLSYPIETNLLSDRKNTDYSAVALLSAVPSFPLSYNGGIKIDWENEDKLYGKTLSTVANATDEDSLKINLEDYDAYRITMTQAVSKFWANGIGLEYDFDISRFTRNYPNYYTKNSDTVRNTNDNDLIVNKQKLTVVPIPSVWGNATLYYEFSKNLSNYIRKEKSGQNTIDWLYRVGATYKNTVFARCTVSEAVSADAKVTRYAFPSINRGNPPPYSRKFTSLTVLNTSITKKISISAEINETYSDNGTLNSREYLDTIKLADPEFMKTYQDYYAIDEKLMMHTIKFACIVNPVDSWYTTLGCAYLLNDAKIYDILTNTYGTSPSAGRRVSPFFKLSKVLGKGIGGNAEITYNFDTNESFWDVLISISGEF